MLAAAMDLYHRSVLIHLEKAPVPRMEDSMSEDAVNMAIRKFLKEVGVTSQREIERVVREGKATGEYCGSRWPSPRRT